MEFSINDETKMLKDSAARFVKEKITARLIKELVKEEKGYSQSLWKEMAELGWLGLIYEEQYGGSGMSIFDICCLFEELGKSGFASPFYSSAILSGMIINEAGDADLKKAYLPALIQGKKLLTIALMDEQGRYDYSAPSLRAEKNGNTYVLNGTRLLVPYANVTNEILVCAEVDSAKGKGPTLFKISRASAGLKIIPLDTLGWEKKFAVVIEGVKASEKDIIGSIGQGAVVLDRVIPKAIIIKCAEMVGGMNRVLDMTVEYMKQRVQFGKPLGVLQAVQHHCADMSTLTETSRLITYQAACFMREGITCNEEVAMAKAWCSDAFTKVTQVSHQLHGGIGFTEEHDLHIFHRQAKVSEYELGDSRVQRRKIADAMGI